MRTHIEQYEDMMMMMMMMMMYLFKEFSKES